MLRFRGKLTLVFTLLIGVTVLGIGALTAKNMKDAHIAVLFESMQREAAVILAAAPWPQDAGLEEKTVYFSEQVQKFKTEPEMRLTFIDAEGTVLADSDAEEAEMDNHLSREEVAAARNTGGAAYSIRYSETLGKNMLYFAVPVKNGSGKISGYLRISKSLSSVERELYRHWTYLFFGLFLLLLLSVTLSYRIAKGLSKPLENITKVAEEITKKNYDARVTFSGRDELGQLGRAVNEMARSLKWQMNQIMENENRLKSVLENMVSGVMVIDGKQKIALSNRSAERILGVPAADLLGKKYDQVKQHLELIRLIEECIGRKELVRDEVIFYFPEERTLEISLVPLFRESGAWSGIVIVLHDITEIRRLERMRSEFVANVSHELKTPIASVKGFAETLLKGAMEDKETAKSFLQIIYDESERLNRLILDILELSKIESKRVPVNFSPVELHSFLHKTLAMMQKQAEKKGIALQAEVQEELYIEADEDRLRQIFLNLISNGINYTPEGGLVKVKAEALPASGEAEEKIRFTVSDTGIGIPKKNLPRIFERFYRVDQARSRSSGGTGLGLSIVKHLVELHRGTITVESKVGAGSRFIIELPVIQP